MEYLTEDEEREPWIESPFAQSRLDHIGDILKTVKADLLQDGDYSPTGPTMGRISAAIEACRKVERPMQTSRSDIEKQIASIDMQITLMNTKRTKLCEELADVPADTFGGRLQQVREALKLDRSEVSLLAHRQHGEDITVQMISNYEREVTGVPSAKLQVLGAIYGVSFDWLFTGHGEMLAPSKPVVDTGQLVLQ